MVFGIQLCETVTDTIMSLLHAFALNAAVLVLAVVLDRLLPEPPNAVHPVVGIGRLTVLLERLAPTRPFAAFVFGCGMVVNVVGSATVLAWIVMVVLASIHPFAYLIGGAALLRTTFTVTGLQSAALETERELSRGQLDCARSSLRNLVSRDVSSLSPTLVAAAAIESVAENSTDSVIAPWLAFACFGVPGAIAYRAINTMDSMIGYRGRYEYLGKPAACLDDLVNLVPARLSAGLLLVAASRSTRSVKLGWQTMRRDAARTASPNAGWTMSAMAGLLGVRLEKPAHYSLGDGFPGPVPGDVRRAVAIVSRASVLGLGVALGLLAVRHAVSG